MWVKDRDIWRRTFEEARPYMGCRAIEEEEE
jgi:hypothetical protein